MYVKLFSIPSQIQPFIFAFMESKFTNNYVQLFKYITENLLKLEPVTIHSDYEASLLKALRKTFPCASLVGCWFHYCQAIRKRLGRNRGRKFFVELKSNAEAYKIYRKILDLPLLPAKNIAEGFSIIHKEITEKRLDGFFKHIFAYFKSYWLPKAI